MAKTPARQPIDFNHHGTPIPKVISDPDAVQVTQGVEYPKHLHRYSGPGQAHEWVQVENSAEEREKREEGFGSAQEADEVGRAAKLKKSEPAAAPAASAAPAKKATKKKANKQAPKKKPAKIRVPVASKQDSVLK